MRILPRALCIALTLAAGSVHADQLTPSSLRGDAGGLWHSETVDGQGLQIDVLEGGRAALSWQTFDHNGQPLWLVGLGDIQGRRIEAVVSSAQGGRFLTQPQLGSPQLRERGLLRIDLLDCDRAELRFADFDGGLGDGGVALKRLTSTEGSRCNAEETFSEVRHFHFEHAPRAAESVVAYLDMAGPISDDMVDLAFGHVQLPAPLQDRRGLRIAGNNLSGELSLLYKLPVHGLEPDTLYHVELALEVAGPVASACASGGIHPAGEISVKLGAGPIEPLSHATHFPGRVLTQLNLGYGGTGEHGEYAIVVGSLPSLRPCTAGPALGLHSMSTRPYGLYARTDANGTLWTHAGFSTNRVGRTELFFNKLSVSVGPLLP